MTSYEHVLSPARFGNLWLPNRVIMAPMGVLMGDGSGAMGEREIAYLTARAAGGTGLVIPGVVFVQRDYDGSNPAMTFADTDECIPGFTALAERIHTVGGRVSIQLSAGQGRNGPPPAGCSAPYSASAVPAFGAPDVTCTALTADQVGEIVQSFGRAAGRVAEAGVDAIDIHGHTGYLIDQFMSPIWNTREDAYGGDLTGRMRFVTEIVAAVKAAAPGLPISFRLSVDHRFPGGRTAEDSRDIARVLAEAGIDLLLADEGSYEAMDYVFPPYYLGDECMRPAARAMTDVLSIPVAACGNITPENAEDILATGDAQFVAVGRGLISEPQWVTKLASGRRAEVRPCIRCNVFCIGHALTGTALGCAVNPQVGFETVRVLRPTAQPKRVVVVGAGPAGLETARVAAERGHDVTVYDKAAHTGGVLWPAATPEFKRELRAMIGWWDGRLAALGVKPVLGTEIRPDSPELEGADAVVVATGSVPVRPDIPGIDTAVGVVEAHLGAELGKRVVVAGGGLSGCDIALELAQAGHEVTVVEMTGAVGADMLPINMITMMRMMGELGVRLLVGHTITAVEDGAVAADGPEGPVRIETDTVVDALGVKADADLYEVLAASREGVVRVGDCVEPAKVGDAIHAGFLAGMEL